MGVVARLLGLVWMLLHGHGNQGAAVSGMCPELAHLPVPCSVVLVTSVSRPSGLARFDKSRSRRFESFGTRPCSGPSRHRSTTPGLHLERTEATTGCELHLPTPSLSPILFPLSNCQQTPAFRARIVWLWDTACLAFSRLGRHCPGRRPLTLDISRRY